MKVATVSDLHLDAVIAGFPRLTEFRKFTSYFEEYLLEEKVDLTLLGGDYFDPGQLNASEMLLELMRFVVTVNAVCPLVMIAGNHDVIEDSKGYTNLTPIDFAAHNGFCGNPNVLIVNDRISFDRVETRSGDVQVLSVPYVAKSVDNPRSISFDLEYETRSKKIPSVVIAHCTSIPGAIEGSESVEMSRGRDCDLPLDLIVPLKPKAVFNGHYHMPQSVKLQNDLEVIIPGAWTRFTFGEEAGPPRGFAVVEFR